MEIICQRVKSIMEECKKRARASGLIFDNESLEYIVTNLDMVDLGPKLMIPTLYDYWVHDVNVLKDRGMYSVYPSNPYETVINTRPVMSFYNDNNPDWLNVMIFYHVLGHIDFFQNNLFFERTWQDDFCGRALSSKVLIDKIRIEQGDKKRFVDYIIECTRSLDNIVGFHRDLTKDSACEKIKLDGRLDYYFNGYVNKKQLQTMVNAQKEIDDYNACVKFHGEKTGEKIFFEGIKKRFPEFENSYLRFSKSYQKKEIDVLDYLLEHSPILAKPENSWMKEVVNIVRDTSLYFQPQLRTKIINEGWASYWHQKLFEADERMSGNEINYSRVNSGVLSMPRIGLNPYAVGFKLFEYIHEMAEKGKFSHLFQKNKDMEFRRKFDNQEKKGMEAIFWVRRNCDDSMLINLLSELDFQDFVDRNNLFVVDKKLSDDGSKLQYYVKSRRGEDYRKMLLGALYNPPNITINKKRMKKGVLFLEHHFEGYPLYAKHIPNVLFYAGYLWGGNVQLLTTELKSISKTRLNPWVMDYDESDFVEQQVLYSMENGKFYKKEINDEQTDWSST